MKIFGLAALVAAVAADFDWTYEDTDEWADMAQYPLCAMEYEQSPIDIDQSDKDEYLYRKDKYLPDLMIEDMDEDDFDPISDVAVINNGRFIELEDLPDSRLMAGGVLFCDYELNRGEIHWGGSEHEINDKRYSGEVTFFFTRDEDCDEDLKHLATREAALSVLLTSGSKDKEAMGELADILEDIIEPEEFVVLTDWNWMDVLPKDWDEDFYTYKGLTMHPPCDIDTTYFVFRNKNSMSRSQLDDFEDLENEEGEEIRRNYRGKQDIGNRVVINSYSSKSGSKKKESFMGGSGLFGSGSSGSSSLLQSLFG